MDFSALAPWADIGAVGVLLLVAVMVYRGKLLPESTVDKLIKPYSDRVDSLEKALALEITRADVRDQQFVKLIDGMRDTNALLAALTKTTERIGQ